MSKHRQTGINVIALTISALLGLGALGALAGCSSGGSSTPPAAAASASGSASSAGPAASASRAPAAKSAAALLNGAVATLRSATSVHVDSQYSTPNGSLSYSNDSTASGGRQVITADGTGHATILLIDGVGYVRADTRGLAAVFEVPQAQAEEFADQWIALRPGNKLGTSTYDDVTSGITLSSVASEVAPSGTPSLAAPSTVAGQRVVAVQGPVAASSQLPATTRAVLYVTDDSRLRPVLSTVTDGSSFKGQSRFSHWGETLHLSAPTNPIPASDVTPVSSVA